MEGKLAFAYLLFRVGNVYMPFVLGIKYWMVTFIIIMKVTITIVHLLLDDIMVVATEDDRRYPGGLWIQILLQFLKGSNC